jgi:hypothetical protein
VRRDFGINHLGIAMIDHLHTRRREPDRRGDDCGEKKEATENLIDNLDVRNLEHDLDLGFSTHVRDMAHEGWFG